MVNSTPNPIKEYYIAYFDILGYKAFFDEQPEKVPELLNAIHDAIRRTTNHIGIANTSPLLHGVAGIDIKAKIFSDNILLCMETSEAQHEQPRLFQFIQIVADIQRGFVNDYGLFVRGAIAKGALSYNDDYVFGQGLIDVVEMEKVAQYPRIVIATSLADFLWAYHACTQDEYNRAIEIENRYKNGEAIPEEEQAFYNQTYSLYMAETYYKRFLDRMIFLWPDNNWILCYINSLDVASVVGEEAKKALLQTIQNISPSDHELLTQQKQDFDNTLARHKIRVEEQLVKFGNNADIATGDVKSAEFKEKTLRKYIWVMALHNMLCDYYQKPEHKILTQCNCDKRFLKMIIEVQSNEAGIQTN